MSADEPPVVPVRASDIASVFQFHGALDEKYLKLFWVIVENVEVVTQRETLMAEADALAEDYEIGVSQVKGSFVERDAERVAAHNEETKELMRLLYENHSKEFDEERLQFESSKIIQEASKKLSFERARDYREQVKQLEALQNEFEKGKSDLENNIADLNDVINQMGFDRENIMKILLLTEAFQATFIKSICLDMMAHNFELYARLPEWHSLLLTPTTYRALLTRVSPAVLREVEQMPLEQVGKGVVSSTNPESRGQLLNQQMPLLSEEENESRSGEVTNTGASKYSQHAAQLMHRIDLRKRDQSAREAEDAKEKEERQRILQLLSPERPGHPSPGEVGEESLMRKEGARKYAAQQHHSTQVQILKTLRSELYSSKSAGYAQVESEWQQQQPQSGASPTNNGVAVESSSVLAQEHDQRQFMRVSVVDIEPTVPSEDIAKEKAAEAERQRRTTLQRELAKMEADIAPSLWYLTPAIQKRRQELNLPPAKKGRAGSARSARSVRSAADSEKETTREKEKGKGRIGDAAALPTAFSSSLFAAGVSPAKALSVASSTRSQTQTLTTPPEEMSELDTIRDYIRQLQGAGPLQQENSNSSSKKSGQSKIPVPLVPSLTKASSFHEEVTELKSRVNHLLDETSEQCRTIFSGEKQVRPKIAELDPTVASAREIMAYYDKYLALPVLLERYVAKVDNVIQNQAQKAPTKKSIFAGIQLVAPTPLEIRDPHVSASDLAAAETASLVQELAQKKVQRLLSRYLPPETPAHISIRDLRLQERRRRQRSRKREALEDLWHKEEERLLSMKQMLEAEKAQKKLEEEQQLEAERMAAEQQAELQLFIVHARQKADELRLKLAVRRILRQWRGYREWKQQRAYQAACRIQRVWRLHVRRVAEQLRQEAVRMAMQEVAAVCIERVWRGYSARKHYRQRRSRIREQQAAMHMQRVLRGHLGRRKARDARQRQAQEAQQRRQTAASTTIQCNYRGWRIRKERERQTRAAIKVQAWSRGLAVRRQSLLAKSAALSHAVLQEEDRLVEEMTSEVVMANSEGENGDQLKMSGGNEAEVAGNEVAVAAVEEEAAREENEAAAPAEAEAALDQSEVVVEDREPLVASSSVSPPPNVSDDTGADVNVMPGMSEDFVSDMVDAGSVNVSFRSGVGFVDDDNEMINDSDSPPRTPDTPTSASGASGTSDKDGISPLNVSAAAEATPLQSLVEIMPDARAADIVVETGAAELIPPWKLTQTQRGLPRKTAGSSDDVSTNSSRIYVKGENDEVEEITPATVLPLQDWQQQLNE